MIEISNDIEDKMGYLNRVLKICDLGRLNLINLYNMDRGIDSLNLISQKHNIDNINGECFNAWLLIKIGSSVLTEIDFNDMVFTNTFKN